MLPQYRFSTASRRTPRRDTGTNRQAPPPANRGKRRKRLKVSRLTIFPMSLAAISGIKVFVWTRSSPLPERSDNSVLLRTEHQDHPVRVYELWPDDFESADFFKSLRDCNIGDGKEHQCIEFIQKGTTTQRIGLLRPPGALGLIVEQFVKEVVSIHGTNETDLQLIPTSYVPPYGYGKTHWYTKIIRFATMPLSLAATDVVRSFPEVADSYTVEDIRQGTRQLVRWHCRLSRVAAHTRLMTLTLESFMEDPWEMEFRVKNFLALGPLDEGNPMDHVLEGKHIEEDELITSLDLVVRHISALLTKIDQVERPRDKLGEILLKVVEEELAATHNLRDWPCLSFWKSGGDSNHVDLDTLNRKIAEAFSPNCTAEYSKYTVPRIDVRQKAMPFVAKKSRLGVHVDTTGSLCCIVLRWMNVQLLCRCVLFDMTSYVDSLI